MLRTLIAEIKLAPGQVGFYDELTNIHLTLTYPNGKVYKGMNTSNLQRAVRSKRLKLISGSLVPAPIASKEEEVKSTYKVKTEKPTVKLQVEAKPEAIEEVVIQEELVEEVVTQEEVTEAVSEEQAEEKATKKKSTKSKK